MYCIYICLRSVYCYIPVSMVRYGAMQRATGLPVQQWREVNSPSGLVS